jgi:uncharacterized membrane protein YGL010W
MLGNRPMADWLRQYAESHQHPVNRALHTLGIPMIVVSLVLAVMGLAWPAVWWPALALFVAGWVFQFIGHAVEGKPPEFFRDWRFLFVGLRWWLAKMAGKA